jgi:preprotein translocase subunit SecA
MRGGTSLSKKKAQDRAKTKKRAVKPDDHFAVGPIEFARFGKMTVIQSHLTQENLDEMRKQMAGAFPALVAEIDALVASIAGRVARLPPDRLLHRAWWEFAGNVLGVGDKRDGDADQLAAMRMIDYVQSLIASVAPAAYADEVSEEEWVTLKADVQMLFSRLSTEYQASLTAYRMDKDPSLDMDLEEFRMQAETMWLNVRGKRYQVHERQALEELLAPHSDVLRRQFGIDATALVNELEKILAALSRGGPDAMRDLVGLQKEAFARAQELIAQDEKGELKDLEAASDKVFEDQDIAARRDKITGAIRGMDLFDVAKNTALPPALIDALTWSPGEDTVFMAPGEFSGWPLRIWPVMKRPFIRLDGRSLCLDMFSLFDNIYRVIRRVIVQREPSYNGTWNERQQAVTEHLPFKYLERLLPGAQIFKPVYYRWAGKGGRAEWNEADGLLLYDEHLFIIEIKAGAFTYTSPADDLPAHLQSLRNLLQAPAHQGSRFIDYLESAPEVSIADSGHNEIGRLRRSDFRHVTIGAVTLDAFTYLSARAQRLKSVGIDVGNRAVWSVSIDDLRVYSELFTEPLFFLHFVEQRMQAGQSKDLELVDEMDHLGLYTAQNNYTQHAAELKAGKLDKLRYNGFRTPIDDYYAAIANGVTPKLVRQEMPERLVEIVSHLGRSTEPRRSELASFLLDAAGDVRDTVAEAIDRSLRQNRELGRPLPSSLYGQMAMTLFVWSPAAPRRYGLARDHTRAVVMANGEASRRLIELEYSEDGKLTGAHLEHVRLAHLSAAELERVKAASIALKGKRLRQAEAKGKVGRNDPCPCGSGRKYKRCHG